MATQRDYYDVLGISKSASASDIKSAHRKLVRKLHPDVNKSDPKASEKFKEVQEAYDVLSDEKKRKAYDQFGHAGVSSSAAAEAAAAAAAAGQARGAPPGGGGFRYSTTTPGGGSVDFGQVDINEILESMMGGNRRGGGARSTGSRGGRRNPFGFGQQPAEVEEETATPDLTHEIALPFETAVKGGNIELRISAPDGSSSQTISVKIPAGVDVGAKIRVRGQGQYGRSGSRGDLIITVKTIEPHPYFTRTGKDLNLDLPVSLTEAANGAVVGVPTLDGPVELRVPANITSGKRLRVKDRGVPQRDGTRGDQFCRIMVQIPPGLTAEDKEKLAAIDQAHQFNPRKDLNW